MGKQVTARELSKIFGKTERTIFRWKDEGIPFADGKYDTAACIEWWGEREIVRRLSETADGKTLDLNAERARHSKEQADKLEMENTVRRGLLMGRDELRAELGRIFTNFKVKLLAIPTKLAPLVFSMKSIPEIMEALKAAIYECLDELAAELRIEGDTAPTKPKRKRVGRRKPKAKPGGKRGAGKVANRKG